jgi:hypothetical protein
MSDIETTKNETVVEEAAPAAPAPAAKVKKVKEPKPAKEPRDPLQKQNGVTRPGGGQTGKVWEISDRLSAEAGAPIARKAVIEEGTRQGINAATIATQYGRWRRFHGLTRERGPKVGEATAAPAAGADVTVEAPKS